jgi:DNA-binding CsgD family transcriptional regulator
VALKLTKVQIADELCISPGGVKFHIKNIYRKFNVHKEAELLSKARELRYVY